MNGIAKQILSIAGVVLLSAIVGFGVYFPDREIVQSVAGVITTLVICGIIGLYTTVRSGTFKNVMIYCVMYPAFVLAYLSAIFFVFGIGWFS